MSRTLRPVWIGRRRYGAVLELQRALVPLRQEGALGDVVLLLEHHPVVTLGRGAHEENVLFSEEVLASRGVDRVVVERGGDVTYHGPGQLVGYPIVDLSPDRCDVRRYVRDLATTMVALAGDFGLGAGTLDGAAYIGTWIDAEQPERWPGAEAVVRPVKIGAIGVKLSRWVTMHGFAFNGHTDLGEFASLIVPCGIRGAFGLTSVAELVGSSPPVDALAERAAGHLARTLDAEAAPLRDLSGTPDEALLDAVKATGT